MSGSGAGPEVQVLLVEDNPDDVVLVRETLLEGSLTCKLHVVPDGFEAMNYLRRDGAYAGVPRPDLILLDLKMPKKGGLEVLAEIKADEELRRIPVIVLTTSESPEEILAAYDLHASCYVTKPADLAEFNRVMKTIKDFCLTIVKLPSRED